MSLLSLNNDFYGLLVRDSSNLQLPLAPLPLASSSVTARVFDFCLEATVEQKYTNYTPFPLECEYVFPLDENSSVVGFVAELNGRTLRGAVEEKSAAKAKFNRAKQQGKSTVLMEQHKENVFKMSIGNLAPHSDCVIRISYITLLELEGKSNRLVVPAVVAPKYSPQQYFGYGRDFSSQVNNSSNFAVGDSTSYKVAPNGLSNVSFFNSVTTHYLQGTPVVSTVPVVVATPPLVAVAKQQSMGPASFTFDLELLMPSEIVSIRSESHPNAIRVALDPIVAPATDASLRLPVPHRATVTLGKDGDVPSLNGRDLVLCIEQKAYLETRAVLEIDPTSGSKCVQLAFCPTAVDMMEASSLQTELIFLIDQSGSMNGSGIEAVRSCLQLFLQSLPVACKFNLISFGSTYKKLFSQSMPYSGESLTTALAYVQRMQADLGGTEILAPLKNCLDEKGDKNFPRQIFLLTDGQVSNTNELITLTKKYCQDSTSKTKVPARVFTFGLGSAADRSLVSGLAEAGCGHAEFITGDSAHLRSDQGKQEVNQKVMRNLIRSMQPSLRNIKVHWPTSAPSSSSGISMNFFGSAVNVDQCKQCPAQLPAIFPPNRAMVYQLGFECPTIPFLGLPQAADHFIDLVVTADMMGRASNASKREWHVPLNISKPIAGNFIHKLAARERIGELQNQTQSNTSTTISSFFGLSKTMNPEAIKAEILRLSLKYQVLSNHTAFIIVDHESKKHKAPKKKKVKTPKMPMYYPAPPVMLMNAQANMFNSFMASNMPQQPGSVMFAAAPAGMPMPMGGVVAQPMPFPMQFQQAQQQQQLFVRGEAAADSFESSDDDDDEGEDGDMFMSQMVDANSLATRQMQPQQQMYGGLPSSSISSSSSSSTGGGGGAMMRKKCSAVNSAPSSNSYDRRDAGGFGFGAAPARGGSNAYAPPAMRSVAVAKPMVSMKSEEKESARRRPSSSLLDAQCDLLSGFIGKPPAAPPAPPAYSAQDPFAASADAALMFDCFAAPSAPAAAAPAPPHPNSWNNSNTNSSSFTSLSSLFLVLVQMSRSDGSWNLNPEFVQLAHRIIQQAQQEQVASHINVKPAFTEASLSALSSSLSVSASAIASLLALWLLNTYFTSRKMEWMMLEGKSKACLANSLRVPIQQFDSITQQILATQN